MVAKITFPKSVNSALNYNEHKIKQGKAECIGAGNLLNNPKDMRFCEKLAVFENRNMLNDRASTHTLHVSLNFSPGEQLTDATLTAIADSYMEMIGFGEQPYFIYKHLDAGHPHLHLVSTTIRQDGSRINTHNIGRNQSEKARKDIEQQYGLVRAEQQKQSAAVKPVENTKIAYGKEETKRSISNVVNNTISSYNYTSLAELNAVLRQFNVVADRGAVEGRIYRSGGLVYRILDEGGNKAGVPIKASSISTRPTLANLEKRFEANKAKREPQKLLLKNRLDKTLRNAPASMQELIQALAQQNVFTLLRQNDEGQIYGVTFVDNQNKAVFNGSELGKRYSIASLQSSFFGASATSADYSKSIIPEQSSKSAPSFNDQVQPALQTSKRIQNSSFLKELIMPEQSWENVPAQLLKKIKKRKKKNRNL